MAEENDLGWKFKPLDENGEPIEKKAIKTKEIFPGYKFFFGQGGLPDPFKPSRNFVLPEAKTVPTRPTRRFFMVQQSRCEGFGGKYVEK